MDGILIIEKGEESLLVLIIEIIMRRLLLYFFTSSSLIVGCKARQARRLYFNDLSSVSVLISDKLSLDKRE